MVAPISTEDKHRSNQHQARPTSFSMCDKFDLAIGEVKKTGSPDTQDVDFHYSFGMLYNDADTFYNLTEAQNANGNYSKARENMEIILKLSPENARFSKINSQFGI